MPARQDAMSKEKRSAGSVERRACSAFPRGRAVARGDRRSRHAGAARPVRPRARQGCLRRRLHRRHQRPQVAPDRRGRAARSSAISNTAARWAPIRAWATAPASWCRSRTSFFPARRPSLNLKLPDPGEYAIGQLFMPREPNWRQIIRDTYAEVIKREGLRLIGWRDVPHDNASLGESVKPTEPSTSRCSSARARRSFPKASSSAGSTCCASRSRARSTTSANGASVTITRCRSPAAR